MEQQMIFSVSEANNFIKALLDRVPQQIGRAHV